mgnify:CR=1 FL=1
MARRSKDFDFEGFAERVDKTLLHNHLHLLTGEITEENCTAAIKWILHENLSSRENKVLTLYINSTGGDLNEAFALIDIMRASKLPIRTVACGSICSAAFLIFACGTKGFRYVYRNTSSMCHQYSSDTMVGKHHELKSSVKELDLTNKRMTTLLTQVTGLDVKTVKSKFLPASDVWFRVEELIEHGIADEIL